MTGYEKSPDYGGPPFKRRELAVFVVVVALVSGGLFVLIT